MKKYSTLLIVLASFLVNIYSQDMSNQNIGKVLNESGSIKPNTTGSYNTEGYEMTYGKNKEPVFSKINSPQGTASYGWGSLGSGRFGTNGTVRAMAMDSSGNIYVGGTFTLVSDIAANNIAKWNGSAWSTLQSGSSNGVNGIVYTIAINGSNVYVGGSFTLLGDGITSAKYIAKWNSGAWSTLPSGSSNGVNAAVYSIAISGSDVYIGGNFTLLGDGTTSAKYIVKWNGGTWSTLTSGASNGVNGAVNTISVNGSDIYVGGTFSFLGDGVTSAKYITKWNGSAWSTLTSGASNGVNSIVSAISVSGSDVYVGGSFTLLGDGTTSAKYIAKWNGTSWTALSSGLSTAAERSTPKGISIPASSGSSVFALNINGSNVYVGGSFTLLGDGTTLVNYLAMWNGSSWATIGSGNNGVNNTVNAIAISGTDIYVGGSFTLLGDGTSAKYIAKWSTITNTWSTLTSGSSNGVNSTVNAIAVNGSDVYIGGNFGLLGDGTTSANCIAKWSTITNTWSTLTSGASNGVNNSVYVIAISGTDIYVGGMFTFLGDGTTSANRIAKWSTATSTWSTLPGVTSNGLNYYVYAIAVSGTDVYVGGKFSYLGNNSTKANGIAKWNTTTSSWSTLTSGASNGVSGGGSEVDAIAVSGSDVYVGGWFTLLGNGTTSANYIAKWSTATSTWSTLTSGASNGVNNSVKAIAVSGSDVYVGGLFTLLGDGTTSAKHIAKWDGSSWSAIDNGVDGNISAMQISPTEGKMYMGGAFTILNNTSGAYYIGTVTDPGNPMPVQLKSFTAHSNGSAVTLNWQTASEVRNHGFDVQRTLPSHPALWEKIGFVQGHGNSNSANVYSFTDNNLQSGRYQYRLKMIDNDASYKYSEVIQGAIGLPNSFALTQNYPNPFNPSTRIEYQVPVDSKVILEVFSITGQKVAELVNQDQQAGYYSVSFGSYSSKLASGVYIYKIAATEKAGGNNFSTVKKMIMLK